MSVDLLELVRVGKAFGGATVLDDLSFAVRQGSLTALLGPNGAGRTMVAELVCGMQRPDAGAIRFAGVPIGHLPAHAVAALGLVRIWRHARPIRGLTVLEQVIAGGFLRRGIGFWPSLLHLPAARRAATAQAGRAHALLARVGLAQRADHPAEALGQGELRRMEVARALAAAPRLLLLDEPAEGLAASDSAAIGVLLRELRDEGMTLLVIAHNMQFVADHCDHVVVMRAGRHIAEGPPATCLGHPAVQDALLGRQQDADSLRARR
ncbi:MAG: ABC transporter ATP-binding protein [Rhodospirillales bacterium]|nr:ABC transporter ATP-binding protein [Rhodospirillales bacterium]